jgi:hypothetical protein
MATLIVPLLVCVVGMLLFVLASNSKLSELGKWAYVVGLFWTVSQTVGHVVHF